MPDILYVVVPCYNEEEVLPETARRLRAKLEALMATDRIAIWRNRGSPSGTTFCRQLF